MSEKSPYKEFGMTGRVISAHQKRHKRQDRIRKNVHLWSGRSKEVVINRHKWNYRFVKNSGGPANKELVCILCGKFIYMVGIEPCKGERRLNATSDAGKSNEEK